MQSPSQLAEPLVAQNNLPGLVEEAVDASGSGRDPFPAGFENGFKAQGHSARGTVVELDALDELAMAPDEVPVLISVELDALCQLTNERCEPNVQEVGSWVGGFLLLNLPAVAALAGRRLR